MLGSHGLNIIDDLQEYRVSVSTTRFIDTITAPGMGPTYIELCNSFPLWHLCTMQLIVVLLKIEVTNYIDTKVMCPDD